MYFLLIFFICVINTSISPIYSPCNFQEFSEPSCAPSASSVMPIVDISRRIFFKSTLSSALCVNSLRCGETCFDAKTRLELLGIGLLSARKRFGEGLLCALNFAVVIFCCI